MKKNQVLVMLLCLCLSGSLIGQQSKMRISGFVTDISGNSLESITVSLHKAADSSVVKITATIKTGQYLFDDVVPGNYLLSCTATGFHPYLAPANVRDNGVVADTIHLTPSTAVLGSVTVVSRKPLVELRADKTIINVDASVTNVGATALEVLEKSPGISVDKNGTISLKGRQNVLVMLDGKQTYLSSTELSNMLGSMSASQIDVIEIMTNPSSKYDAAGSTGIINIKTKKIRVKGFNGSATVAYGQGFYPKSNNSLMLNYRDGKFNYFLNYSFNMNHGLTDMYALRKYYEPDGKTITSMLEQPYFYSGRGQTHSLRAGIDYFIGRNTTVGISLTGLSSKRKGWNNSTALWMNATGAVDSTIETRSDNSSSMDNAGANINFRHSFNTSSELTADLDFLGYKLGNNQYFENELKGPAGYTETIKGHIPSTIQIFSAKTDYSHTIGKNLKIETGGKTSRIKTDNLAEYFLGQSGQWKEDYSKTNHFLYAESIHALYVNLEKQFDKLTIQGGLRYESTSYEAEQKGNPTRKDSSFSRNYNSLFPTAFLNYKADSINSFSFSAGRRIDRPVFQKLNPFVFVINKYTYQSGNPFFLPQYTWNFELSHMFRDMLMTTLSYGITRDYFSQIFFSDTSGLITYTEGNLGKMRNVGLSVSSQFSLASWWSVSLSASVNNKKIEGFVWNARTASLTQGNININNQFKFNKGWSGELSGFYNSSEQELQEITDPTGQVGIGVTKLILKNKGSLKLALRDIFYTQVMKGNTTFKQATEYFKLQRDTRVINIAFIYRFGKPLKGAIKRTNGGAADEIQRVGSGG